MNFLELDFYIFKIINSEWSNSVFDVFFPYWTDFQRGPVFSFLLLPLILIVVFTRARWSGLGFLALGLAAMSLADLFFGQLLKEMIERPRPAFSEIFAEVILRGPSFGGFSFPSSHSVDAFCFAVFIGYFFKKLRWPLLFLASLTAYSRVYCGLHFPSDVVGGAILGSAFGWLMALGVQHLLRLKKEGLR